MMLPDTRPAHARQRHSANERRTDNAPARTAIVFAPPVMEARRDSDEGGGYRPPPEGLEYAKKDGVSHINIYSRSEVRLGNQLSHFASTPFVHPHYGPFNSMEGFWYYIKAANGTPGLDQLRRLVGWWAKQYGRQLPIERRASFKEVIIEANFHKIVQTPELCELMRESTLPFDHYYLFEPKVKEGEEPAPPVFVRPSGFAWLVEGFERIRRELKTAHDEQREPLWPQADYTDIHPVVVPAEEAPTAEQAPAPIQTIAGTAAPVTTELPRSSIDYRAGRPR